MPDRRIDFIRLDSGEMLGDEKFCPEKVHLKSWYYWMSTCSYCFCYCDAPGPASDRHFSLREVLSNITENKYVAGSMPYRLRTQFHIFPDFFFLFIPSQSYKWHSIGEKEWHHSFACNGTCVVDQRQFE